MSEATLLFGIGTLFTTFSGLIGFVWWSFNRRLQLELETINERSRVNYEANRIRIERIEKEVVDQLPLQIKDISSQLKAIELLIASSYPTKLELKDTITNQNERLDRIERLILEHRYVSERKNADSSK